MAVLFAEGFSGVPRASTGFAATALASLGYIGKVVNNSTSDVTTNTSFQVAIVPDVTFGDRSRITMLSTNNAFPWMAQLRKPLDTSGFTKFVIGFVARVESPITNTPAVRIMLSGNTPITSSATAPADMLGYVNIPVDGTTKGYVAGYGTAPVTIDVVKGQEFHFEVLIEEDVDRLRIYIDGALKIDMTYTGTFASATGGFSLDTWLPAALANQATGASYSNVYVLGLDAVHTGTLGPAARIIEVAPPGDMDVHWTRPDSYTTNAAVLAQAFSDPAPDYLAASNIGDYDVYSAPSAVAANAAQVFGAGFKVNAMTMASGTHTIKPVVKTASGVHEIGKEAALQLGVIQPIFVDASVNPDTNAVWTPSAVSVSGFGIKLKS